MLEFFFPKAITRLATEEFCLLHKIWVQQTDWVDAIGKGRQDELNMTGMQISFRGDLISI